MSACRTARRMAAVLGALGFLATATACTEAPAEFLGLTRVNVAYKGDQPGTSYWDGEKYSGFDSYVGEHIVDELGVRYSPKLVTSNVRETEITSGETDLVIATYSITEPREEKVAFAGPYAVSTQGYMVGPDDPDIQTTDDLKGKNICTMTDTTAAAALTGNGMKKPDEVATASMCVELLLNGGTDAFFMDKMILYGFKQKYPGMRILAEDVGLPQFYGVGMPKGHLDDCERMQKILESYVRSGKWTRDFEASLSQFAREHPAEVDKFRPNPDLLEKYSCQG